MPEPDIGDRIFTGYPLGLTRSAYEQSLRQMTVAELEDSLEVKRWLVLEPECQSTVVQTYFRYQIEVILAELLRRRKLLEGQRHHPLAPAWQSGELRNSRERIERIRQRWPIDLFLTQSLGCTLTPRGPHAAICRCPLPNHDDSSPSFHVDLIKNVGYCFGCQRGGDVIELTRWYLNNGSFMDALHALEQEGHTFDNRHTR